MLFLRDQSRGSVLFCAREWTEINLAVLELGLWDITHIKSSYLLPLRYFPTPLIIVCFTIGVGTDKTDVKDCYSTQHTLNELKAATSLPVNLSLLPTVTSTSKALGSSPMRRVLAICQCYLPDTRYFCQRKVLQNETLCPRNLINHRPGILFLVYEVFIKLCVFENYLY